MSKPLSDEQLLALFRQKLHEESQRWAEENMLTAEQREIILQHYENLPPTMLAKSPSAESSPTESVKEFPLFIRVVLALAVVLVGMAVLLLVSFNWEYLPGEVKLLIVGVALATAHATGYWLRKTGWKNWADGVFFFAGIMYGVGIWQVGQVSHIPTDFSILWLWAFGAFLLALPLANTPLHLLSAVLLVVWAIAGMVGERHFSWVFATGFVPFSACSLPIISAIGIGAGVLTQKRFVVTLYTVLLGFWWILQGINCVIGPCLTFHIAAVGLICIALSSWRFNNVSNVALARIGALLILGGLFVPSFLSYWYSLLSSYHWKHPRIVEQYAVYQFWAIALPAINYSILFALFVLRDHKDCLLLVRRNKMIVVLAVSVFLFWFGACFTSMMGTPGSGQYYHQHYLFETLFHKGSGQFYFHDPLAPTALVGMLAVNALIVMLTIWLIVVGLKRNLSGWFWSGVLFFLFWAIIRYIDMFSDFGGMLGAAGIFLFCGLSMLGIVYFWTTQRQKFRTAEPIMESSPEFTVPLWFATIYDKLSCFWQSERNVLKAVAIVALLQFALLVASPLLV